MNHSADGWPEPDPTVGTSFDAEARPPSPGRAALKRRLPLGGRLETAYWLARTGARGVRLPGDVAITTHGAGFEVLVDRLGRSAIEGATVLLQGAGSGAEVRFWAPYRPRVLVGVDLYLDGAAPCPLAYADLRQLPFPNEAFDGAGSINVLEHVVDVDAAMRETIRTLAPGGWFLASFGPLFHALGGDHLSYLRGGLEHGFNHLLLDEDRYRSFVDAMTVPGIDEIDDEPRAGLAYIRSGMFSRLRFDEYQTIFDRWLDVRFLRGLVDVRALAYRRRFPEHWRRLLDSGIAEHDLLISTVQVIGRAGSA